MVKNNSRVAETERACCEENSPAKSDEKSPHPVFPANDGTCILYPANKIIAIIKNPATTDAQSCPIFKSPLFSDLLPIIKV